jgi:hypothetical protein
MGYYFDLRWLAYYALFKKTYQNLLINLNELVACIIFLSNQENLSLSWLKMNCSH